MLFRLGSTAALAALAFVAPLGAQQPAPTSTDVTLVLQRATEACRERGEDCYLPKVYLDLERDYRLDKEQWEASDIQHQQHVVTLQQLISSLQAELEAARKDRRNDVERIQQLETRITSTIDLLFPGGKPAPPPNSTTLLQVFNTLVTQPGHEDKAKDSTSKTVDPPPEPVRQAATGFAYTCAPRGFQTFRTSPLQVYLLERESDFLEAVCGPPSHLELPGEDSKRGPAATWPSDVEAMGLPAEGPAKNPKRWTWTLEARKAGSFAGSIILPRAVQAIHPRLVVEKSSAWNCQTWLSRVSWLQKTGPAVLVSSLVSLIVTSSKFVEAVSRLGAAARSAWQRLRRRGRGRQVPGQAPDPST